MLIIEILKRARALIKQGWCQHTGARDENGVKVHIKSDEARFWCTTGALYIATKDLGDRQRTRYQLMKSVNTVWKDKPEYIKRKTDLSILMAWNDMEGQTKENVLKTFDLTIRRLAEERK